MDDSRHYGDQRVEPSVPGQHPSVMRATAAVANDDAVRHLRPVSEAIPIRDDPAIELTERLREALAGDEHRVRRLVRAATSVTICVDGDEAATLLLDRRPPVVTSAPEPAEVTIFLSAEQARAFTAGTLKLPAAVLARRVECRGPVRKFLAVEPILRSLLHTGQADVDR
jgi:hypothetical protein